MLYLRTGGNGSGKTLFTLKDVRALQLETGRPVCFNIRPADDVDKPDKPYCNLKDSTIAEFGWTPFRFKDWQDQVDGTIFLVDECHYDLPKRPNGSAAPLHIAKLTEHRSRGFDFFLLTQHPSNFDTFVQKLVQAPGWHQHIKRMAGALPVASVLQWDAVNNTCEKAGSGKSAEVKTRPYPKDVYTWYDSAPLHTGRVRIPKAVYILGACVLLIPALVYFSVTKLNAKGEVKNRQDAVAMSSAFPAPAGPPGPKAQTVREYVDSFSPRIPGLAHTAPRYDDVQKVAQAPKPAACIDGVRPGSGKRSCQCWTQQATVLPVPEDVCRQIVAGGYFDETSQPAQLGPAGSQAAILPTAAPVRGNDGPTVIASAGYGLRDPGYLAGRNAATVSLDDQKKAVLNQKQ